MLTKPSIESLLPKVDSRYTLAILVAKRARQLVIGGQSLVSCDSPNTVTQACEELAGDRLAFVRGDLPIVHSREQFSYGVYVGLRPEVIAARMQQQDPESRANDLADDLGEDLEATAAAAQASAEAVAEAVAEADALIEAVEADDPIEAVEAGDLPAEEPAAGKDTE